MYIYIYTRTCRFIRMYVRRWGAIDLRWRSDFWVKAMPWPLRCSTTPMPCLDSGFEVPMVFFGPKTWENCQNTKVSSMVGEVLWTWFFLIIWWRIGAPSGENQGKLFPKRPQPLRFSRSPKTCRTCFKHFGLRQIDGKWKTTWFRRSLVFLVDIGSHYLGLSENLATLNELAYHCFSPLYKLASSRLNIDPSGLNRSRIRDPLRMPKSNWWRNVALILVRFFSHQLPGCFSVPLQQFQWPSWIQESKLVDIEAPKSLARWYGGCYQATILILTYINQLSWSPTTCISFCQNQWVGPIRKYGFRQPNQLVHCGVRISSNQFSDIA